MPRCRSVVSALVVLVLGGFALAAEPDPASGIRWELNLTDAVARAKETGRILMICVNAKHVDGREDEEPAAKGLREVVYRDPRVVKRSHDFVCAMISPKSSVADHGVLGNLGVVEPIISPQHIFVSPDGQRVLLRKEYWSYGKGDKAVEKLLSMMETAKRKLEDPDAPDDVPNPGNPANPAAPATPKLAGPPADEAGRAEWIQQMLTKLDGGYTERDAALAALVRADRDGDCTNPLIEKMKDSEKNTELLRALIRALGRNGLDAAAEPIADYLTHRNASIRAEAAVSLEYIGCKDKKVVVDLLKAADRERDEAIANHMYRALGRCGVDESRALAFLLKSVGSAKREFASYGPAIGLAYFEGNARAARGVEEILKRMGVPGGRRGAGQNTVKRALLSWTLSEIGDEKSEAFVNEVLVGGLENVQAFWVQGLRRFWQSVARKCGGDETARGEIEEGVRITVGFASRWGGRGRGRGGDDDGDADEEPQGLMDAARKDREGAGFTPKGDGLLTPRGGGGGGPGGGGPGGGGPGGGGFGGGR